MAVAPGYAGTPMVKGMNQKALETILRDVPIGRLIQPEEVASLLFFCLLIHKHGTAPTCTFVG